MNNIWNKSHISHNECFCKYPLAGKHTPAMLLKMSCQPISFKNEAVKPKKVSTPLSLTR